MSFLLPKLVPATLEELAPKPDEDATLRQRELALKVTVRQLAWVVFAWGMVFLREARIERV